MEFIRKIETEGLEMQILNLLKMSQEAAVSEIILGVICNLTHCSNNFNQGYVKTNYVYDLL